MSRDVALLAESPGLAAPTLIAARLRDEILRGLIPGDVRMRQDAVAGRFGVSQNTAREAFRQLEAEGLLRAVPRRGVSVVPLSAGEAGEITTLRSLLEVQALEWALPQLDATRLAAASAILDQLDDAATMDDILAGNAAFHRLLYAACDRARTLALIETLRLNFERYLRLTWQETDRRTRSQREHRALLRLCGEGDGAGAAALLREHIAATGRAVLQRLST